jgi:Zn-dependent peptidase ImmA (M78 family)
VSQCERDRAEVYALALAEVFSLIEQEVELPVPDFPSPLGLGPEAEREELESAALRLRATWSVPPGPVANVVRLLEAHGTVVAAVGVFDDGMDAFSLWPSALRPVVVLCSDKGAAARRRFDAAHELGHLILHGSATNEQWQEKQAHQFAASLLMPADEVEPWLPRRSNDIELLQDGSRTWGVSMQALLYRGRELETLSESAYLRAMRRMSAAGWRSSEPVALGPPEAPTLLAKAVQAFVESGQTIGDLAERFGVPEGRLQRMLSLPEDSASRPPAQVLTLPRFI